MLGRCVLCPGVNRCVDPHGPQERGGLLFIGEACGKVENDRGIPFIGKTGDEVNRHYLPLAGLRREAVTFHNAISCYPISAGGKLDPNRAKDLALLASCATARLYPLIERMQPRAIIPMGSFACKAVCPGVNLELQHGFPVSTEWGIPAFPSYHPALGIHSPKQMLYIRTDWQRLRKFLAGTLRVPRDPYPNPDYAEVTDESEIAALDPRQPIAMDTESGREGPYCLTYSQRPGTGRLIRAERGDLLRVLQMRLSTWRSEILFHNWLYDWPIVEAMGLYLPVERVVDTMARVYHLGNLPQGLKALGWRQFGVVMDAFEDVVSPYSSQIVLDYYRDALAEDWPTPEPELVRGEDGKLKLYKAQSIQTKLKRFFTDLKKQPEKDVFAAWDNWADEHAQIEAMLGPWPGMDIRHVPFEKIITYACRDADITLRLWHLIQGMAPNVRRYDQAQWVERARVA